MTTTSAIRHGLEGVVMTSTRMSRINGETGELLYAGYSVHELAEHARFEEVCWLLWHGELPTPAQLAWFDEQLACARQLTNAELALVEQIPACGHGMDALRTLASALAQHDPRAGECDVAAAERVGIQLLGKLPVLISAWDRHRRGLAMVGSDGQAGQAATLLTLLHGVPPTTAQERALNCYMVLLAEHGLNASTLAARVAVSARSDPYSAIGAAIGTLKGRLHGGANQLAMEAFLEIGHPTRAAAYIEQLLAQHGRLMGIGHRIYKVEDPRVRHLRRAVGSLANNRSVAAQAIAERVEEIVVQHPYFVERQLNPNVEFYSAPLLYTLGFPLDLFTVAFALSRIAGWVGHMGEQIAEGRIIRPKAAYHGPAVRAYPLESHAIESHVISAAIA